MNKKNLLSKIASVATELDYAGFAKEAKHLDDMLIKIAYEDTEPMTQRGYSNDLPAFKILKSFFRQFDWVPVNIKMANSPEEFLNRIKEMELDGTDKKGLLTAITQADEHYPEYSIPGKMPAFSNWRETGYDEDENRQFLIDAYQAVADASAGWDKREQGAMKYLERVSPEDAKKRKETYTIRPDLGLF